jgi:hypothetical protein
MHEMDRIGFSIDRSSHTRELIDRKSACSGFLPALGMIYPKLRVAVNNQEMQALLFLSDVSNTL